MKPILALLFFSFPLFGLFLLHILCPRYMNSFTYDQKKKKKTSHDVLFSIIQQFRDESVSLFYIVHGLVYPEWFK